MMLLEGRKALVTGGGSGIGRAACLIFAREGASVCVADRNVEAAEAVAREIANAGGRALAVEADVSVASDVVRMLDRADGAYGPVDCYFNNAGIGTTETHSRGKPLADIELEDWNRMIGVNLTGVFLCLKYQLPRLKRGGSIVNNASIGGLIGLPNAAAYVASKHGVVALTKSAAVEYGQAGIRVNAVCPGHVATPLLGSNTRDGDALSMRNPMQRYGSADEIAELVAWLSSSRASFVNGSTFTADGGRLAGG
ncbi:SDR family NAD(P)-dependent oxidoreductase [Ramlibacter sp.]|uniref:SDR family NAD(P)-dependent oxidoreductase n=1 Tax=Ramlibacter sp. TaxID=1917967 RepID=UPI003D0CC218